MSNRILPLYVVQLNPTVGDLEGNYNLHINHIQEAVKQGSKLVIFPEHSLTGYPLEDLVLRADFMHIVDVYVKRLVQYIRDIGDDIAVIFGAPEKNGYDLPYNSAYFVESDPTKLIQITRKHELPNYGTFDEKRTYSSYPLEKISPIVFGDIKIGLLICEDLWFPRVSNRLKEQGANCLVSINGSPFEMGKNVTRIKVASLRNTETSLPVLYVNMYGGQDELVFDGGSFVLTKTELYEFNRFYDGGQYDLVMHLDDHTVNGIPLPTRRFVKPNNDPATVYHMLVQGTRDYARKQGFKSFTLGMSGGVDSGIVAAIACDVFSPQNTHLVSMPSKFSSKGSIDDSMKAAERLGCNLETIYIEDAVEIFRNLYRSAKVNYTTTTQIRPTALTGVSDENIQPRIRGTYLMAKSNQEGHLVLSTGNKSEMSVGYATLYGDMCGGLNPLKDVYKTQVWDLCRYRNSLTRDELCEFGYFGNETEVVPEEIIIKPPSAELRENQLDLDSLPPYEVLDPILRYLIEGEKLEIDVDFSVVRRISDLVLRAEYKRRQACPGIKITSKPFGRDRRMPITNSFKGFQL